MGTGKIVCGRELIDCYRNGPKPGKAAAGWYEPYPDSPEYRYVLRDATMGEVYADVTLGAYTGNWWARIHDHDPKQFDTCNEAMLYVEAVAALID